MPTDDLLFLARLELMMEEYRLGIEDEYDALDEKHFHEGGLWGPDAEEFAELREAAYALRLFAPTREWWAT